MYIIDVAKMIDMQLIAFVNSDIAMYKLNLNKV